MSTLTRFQRRVLATQVAIILSLTQALIEAL